MSNKPERLRVGIDASNIRAGGGVTHLAELVRNAEPERHGVTSVVVWGGKDTLDRVASRPWLELQHEAALDGPLTKRLAWQRRQLTSLAKENCDVLFVPGGSYSGDFSPFITMAQNQLVFEPKERQRYGLSKIGLRLKLLVETQSATFRRAAGIIFLTETTRRMVEPRLDIAGKPSAVIPHGINPSFRRAVRKQEAASAYSVARPFKFLYVSIIDVYKHQWQVVEAVAQLRRQGMPVELDLVGPYYPPALRRLRKAITEFDPREEFIHYRGPAGQDELLKYYQDADAFVFASSCESFGLVLADAMAAGLPIACSDRSVLPEVLGDAGIYFNPEQARDIARALESLFSDAELRGRYARLASERSELYTWERCAEETFRFIASVIK